MRSGLFNEIRADVVAKLIGVVEDNTTIAIDHDSVPDQCKYNAPTSDQVVGVLVESVADMSNHGPHILVHGKSNNKHQIRHYHGCYDPLKYSIIFPLGIVDGLQD